MALSPEDCGPQTPLPRPHPPGEAKGVVERFEEDPTGAFYDTLAVHYGSSSRYRGDPRVIFYVKIHRIVGQGL